MSDLVNIASIILFSLTLLTRAVSPLFLSAVEASICSVRLRCWMLSLVTPPSLSSTWLTAQVMLAPASPRAAV